MVDNHANIASLWSAYLANKGYCERLTPLDAACMMLLMKVARTQLGKHKLDNYIDAAGYAAIAGQIAEVMEIVGEKE